MFLNTQLIFWSCHCVVFIYLSVYVWPVYICTVLTRGVFICSAEESHHQEERRGYPPAARGRSVHRHLLCGWVLWRQTKTQWRAATETAKTYLWSLGVCHFMPVTNLGIKRTALGSKEWLRNYLTIYFPFHDELRERERERETQMVSEWVSEWVSERKTERKRLASF